MEPFGLFQFLQSLLNSPAPTPQDADKPAPELQRESTPAPPQPPEAKGSDTYAKFISAHEARIQKTRK